MRQRYTNLYEHNECCSFFWNGSSIIEQHCTCRTKIARKCKVGGGSDLKSWLTIYPTWTLCMAYTLMSLRIIDFVILEIFDWHWLRNITCIHTMRLDWLYYFWLPPKSVMVINSATVGWVQMWKVEYFYGKTNRTHAHTTKFTIFIGFVSHINSIIWT